MTVPIITLCAVLIIVFVASWYSAGSSTPATQDHTDQRDADDEDTT